MQYKIVKTAKETGLSHVEFVKEDSKIVEVIIDGVLRIKPGVSYSNELSVMVEQPYEKATRYQMKAEVEGFDPKTSYHENESDAFAACADLADGVNSEVSEVEVWVDVESGEVVGIVEEDEEDEVWPLF